MLLQSPQVRESFRAPSNLVEASKFSSLCTRPNLSQLGRLRKMHRSRLHRFYWTTCSGAAMLQHMPLLFLFWVLTGKVR